MEFIPGVIHFHGMQSLALREHREALQESDANKLCIKVGKLSHLSERTTKLLPWVEITLRGSPR